MLTNVKDVVKKLVNNFDTRKGHTFQNDQDDLTEGKKDY